MSRIIFYGLACALAPWVLARLHFCLGGLTKALVYCLGTAQILLVPVLVALDPDISFGSDVYSLGGGIAIMLITAVELVFAIGTAVGVIAGTSYINRRERAAAGSRAAAMFSNEPLNTSITDLGTVPVSHLGPALPELPNYHGPEPTRSETIAPVVQSSSGTSRPPPSLGLTLVGAYLCFVLAMAGGTILVDGLSLGSFGWVRNFGAVSFDERPIAFVAVTIMFLTPTFAAGWGVVSLLSRLRQKPRRS